MAASTSPDPSLPMADASPQVASSSAHEETAQTFSRAYLRSLHEKPMLAAWSRHVTGALEFIKARVLTCALAGNTEQDFSAVIDVVPTADEVLVAMGSCETVVAAPAANPLLDPFRGGQLGGQRSEFGVAETWSSNGKLDPKTGLLLVTSSFGT